MSDRVGGVDDVGPACPPAPSLSLRVVTTARGYGSQARQPRPRNASTGSTAEPALPAQQHVM